MRVIAVEEHYASELIWEALGGLGRAPRGSKLEGELTDLGDARIAAMDAAGIDMQVLSLKAPGGQGLDPAGAAVVREENDRLAEAISLHPDRLAAFAALVTADPAAAAAELERTVREHGFKGALIHGHTGGTFLDDPSYWPMFEVAAALRVPIYLHPTRPLPAVKQAYFQGFSPKVGEALSNSAWGWHVENGLHVLRLILAGVFDRFPELQLVIGHLGELLPFMLSRTTTKLPQDVTGLRQPVSAYFQTNIHVTTSGFFAAAPLLGTVLEIGADRVLFAVDSPLSTNEEGRAFLDAMPLSLPDREKIAHGNAERLLRL